MFAWQAVALGFVVGAGVIVHGDQVHAAEGTEIASGSDDLSKVQLFFGLNYSFSVKNAAIKREMSGEDPTETSGIVPIMPDLLLTETRQMLTPHVEVGFARDFQVHFALPITLSWDRSYDFDQSASPCVFSGGATPETCIDRTNSSTLVDGLLPNGDNGQMGYDAQNPMVNFAPTSKTVFRSVTRSGLDTFNVGVSWTPMNQARDDTKPTWVLDAELHLSIGKLMKFDRFDPSTQAGVSEGVHEIKLSTGFSKRTAWAEPYIYFWWQAPLAVRGSTPGDPNGSLYWDVGFGQKSTMPQQQAGTYFGFNAVVSENPKTQTRFSLDLGGRLEAHFNGQGYSEIWEILAYAGDVKNNPNGPLVVHPDPTNPVAEPISYPGTSTIENYLTFAGKAGAHVQIGAHVRLSADLEVTSEEEHAITFTDAGKVTPPNTVVQPGTAEVNPLQNPLIDDVGRRYLVDDSLTYTVLVSGQILF